MTDKKARVRLEIFIKKARELKKSARYFMHSFRDASRQHNYAHEESVSLRLRNSEYWDSIQEANRLFRRIIKIPLYSSQVEEDLSEDVKLYIKRHENI